MPKETNIFSMNLILVKRPRIPLTKIECAHTVATDAHVTCSHDS